MFLRTAALTAALILVFVSGLLSQTTRDLSVMTQTYLVATVGLSASVTPNGVNQYTAALAAKEQQLNQQAAQLKQREIAVNAAAQSANSNNGYTVFILSVIVFILLVLIIINYVLDYVRAYRRTQSTKAV